MTLRYEGVRFSDGAVAVRRVAADPCDRATLTFESVRELEEDIGSADVSWIVDGGAGSTRRRGSQPIGHMPSGAPLYVGDGHPALRAPRLAGETPVSLPCPAAEHHHRIVAGYACCECGFAPAEPDHYLPEPEDVESV